MASDPGWGMGGTPTVTILAASRDVSVLKRLEKSAGAVERGWTLAGADTPVSWPSSSRRSQEVNVIVLDDDSEEGAGLRWLGLVREGRAGAPVVYLTSRREPEHEMAIRRAGVLFYGVKPLADGLLERVVERAVLHETTRVMQMSGTGRVA